MTYNENGNVDENNLILPMSLRKNILLNSLAGLICIGKTMIDTIREYEKHDNYNFEAKTLIISSQSLIDTYVRVAGILMSGNSINNWNTIKLTTNNYDMCSNPTTRASHFSTLVIIMLNTKMNSVTRLDHVTPVGAHILQTDFYMDLLEILLMDASNPYYWLIISHISTKNNCLARNAMQK